MQVISKGGAIGIQQSNDLLNWNGVDNSERGGPFYDRYFYRHFIDE